MRERRSSVAVIGLSLCICLLAAVPGRAQEGAKVGLVAGYPASIGVLWHVSDAVAVRPDVTFSKASGDSAAGNGTLATSSGTSVAVSVAGLFYLSKWENLRSYVSPRFTYGRSTSDSTYGGSSPSVNSTATVYAVTGSFGAEYALGRRFAVFGEAGFGYSHQRNESTNTAFASTVYQSESTSKSWSTRTAVGVILYF